MATTLDQYLPYDSGAGANTTESGWRDMMKHMAASQSGVIRGFDTDFNVFGDSSGMQVKVQTGQCFIRGHYGRCAAQKTLAIAASHATLNRRDAVILRNDFINNRIELDVLTGTPAASPTFPTLTTNTSIWETLLAEVTVNAAVVTITAGSVIDRRVYTTSFGKFTRTTTQSINNTTFTAVLYDQYTIQSGDIGYDGTTGQITLNRSGLWLLNNYVGFTNNVTGTRQVQINDSSTTTYVQTSQPAPIGVVDAHLTTTTFEKFTAGQIVRGMAWQNSGGALNTLAGKCIFTAMWVGP